MTFANFSISQSQTVVAMTPEGGSGLDTIEYCRTAGVVPLESAAAITIANIAPADDSDEISLQGERKGSTRLDWACARCAPGLSAAKVARAETRRVIVGKKRTHIHGQKEYKTKRNHAPSTLLS